MEYNQFTNFLMFKESVEVFKYCFNQHSKNPEGNLE